MPFVNIKLTRENNGLTVEQKERLIEGATRLLVDVLGRGQQTTVVVIEEVDTDSYGIGGETVTKRRQQGK